MGSVRRGRTGREWGKGSREDDFYQGVDERLQRSISSLEHTGPTSGIVIDPFITEVRGQITKKDLELATRFRNALATKAIAVLDGTNGETKRVRPTLDDFRQFYRGKMYGMKERRDDALALIEQKRSETETPRILETISRIFELAVLDVTERGKWLGEHTAISLSSRYDDVVNGIDGFVSLDKGIRPGAAVDITMASAPDVVRDKFFGIQESLESEGLFTANNFMFKGEKYPEMEVPKVVIAISSEIVKQFLNLWCLAKSEEDIKRLYFHPLRTLMIWQCVRQCHHFAGVGNKIYLEGGDRSIENSYRNALSVFEAGADEMGGLYGDHLSILEGSQIVDIIRDFTK